MAIAAAVVGAAVALPASAATGYYVSTTGNDANAGTSIAAPFRTIQKCASVAVAGDTCQIRGGVYRETVKPAHSGTPGAPIVFTAFNNETVTVNGADVVTGWTKQAGQIYSANVTLPVSNETSDYTKGLAPDAVSSNQLFIDGVMTGEAAWPNGSADAGHQATSLEDVGTQVSAIVDSSLPNGVDFTGAVEHVVSAQGWTASTNIVTSSAPGKFAIQRHCSDPNCNYPGAKYFLTGGNHGLQLLDTPGEWWYDWTAHKLYLWTPRGDSPAAHRVEAKQRKTAFDLADRAYVDVFGLGIFSATVLTNANSHNVILDGIKATYVSHSLTLTTDPQDVNGCGIWCDGATSTGLILDGSNNTLRNSVVAWSSANGVSLAGTGMTVTNNLVHDVDYLGGYPSGINFGFHGAGAVTHNTVYNSGRFLISLNPGTKTAYAEKISISYNNLYNYGFQTRDLGAIYICCHSVDAQQSSIDHNWTHNSAVADLNSSGIFMDDGASGFVVHHNVFWATGRFGFKINASGSGSDGSSHDSAYNNTFTPGVQADEDGVVKNLTGSVIKNNLWAQGATIFTHAMPNAVISNNSSNTVPPQLVNLGVHDYRLQASSPAIDAGVPVAGVTDGYRGKAPDQGAYERGGLDWIAGCGLLECRATTDGYLGVAAGSYSTQLGIGVADSGPQGSDVESVDNGDYTGYAGIDLTGAKSLALQVASPRAAPGTVQARVDSPTGAILATCTVPGTGGWQNWTTITCPTAAGIGGKHTVYLTYHNPTTPGPLFNVAWFRISTTGAGSPTGGGGGGGSPTPVVGGHVYTLSVVSTGQKADVEGASPTAGAPVLHWNTNSALNQQWRAVDAGGGAITLVAVHSGQCMDVRGRFLTPGVVVQQWPCNGGTNQRWTLSASGATGGFAVKSVNSGLCLDAAHGPAVKVAQLTQWTCDGGTTQQWRFAEKVSTGVGA